MIKNLFNIHTGYTERYENFYAVCYDRINVSSVKYLFDIKDNKLLGYAVQADDGSWECFLKWIKNTHKFKEMKAVYKNFDFHLDRFDFDIDTNASLIAIGLENEE